MTKEAAKVAGGFSWLFTLQATRGKHALPERRRRPAFNVPSPHRKPRVAVLVDAENVSTKLVSKAMSVAQNAGRVTLKRVYGTFPLLQSGAWNAVVKPLGIEPVVCAGYVAGKNSSDIRLVIDAMRALYDQSIDVFVIVSSDSDFIPLVREIRATGRIAYGIGSPCSPDAYQSACDEFYAVRAKPSTPRPQKAKPPRKARKKGADPIDGPVLRATRECMLALEPEGGWCDVTRLCNRMRKTIPDFTPGKNGCSNMASFARETGILETRKGKEGMRVRLIAA